MTLFKKIAKRIISGTLAALTIFQSVPIASATEVDDDNEAELQALLDSLVTPAAKERGIEYPGELADRMAKFQEMLGIVPYGAEEDKPSAAVISTDDPPYLIKDLGAEEGLFYQSNQPKNVWRMVTTLSDGTSVSAYCADHTKGNPGKSGLYYTITKGIRDDKRLIGVLTHTDARVTVEEFLNNVLVRNDKFEGSEERKLTTANFRDADPTGWPFFCASQIAVWVALGDAYIPAGSGSELTWNGSEALGYTPNAAGAKKPITPIPGNALSERTVYAALKLLEIGNAFNALWEDHYPYVGTGITYTQSSSEFNAETRKLYSEKDGPIQLDKGIVNSGFFGEKTCDGIDCYVLPMAVGSATHIRGTGVKVTAKNMPQGAFLMSAADETNHQSQTLTLAIENNDGPVAGETGGPYLPNDNGESYGARFYLCIPKNVAQELDASKTPLNIELSSDLNVDRYEAFYAHTANTRIQPVALIEPAVLARPCSFKLTTNPDGGGGSGDPEYTQLKVIKKEDGTGALLKDAKFKITWTENGANKEKSASTNDKGEAVFGYLPLNTQVTIEEITPPPGHKLSTEKVKTATTKSSPTEVATVEFSNPVADASVKIIKTDSKTGNVLDGVVNKLRAKSQYTESGQQQQKKQRFWRSA